MDNLLFALLGLGFALYLVTAAFFIISENRRPQSTYAWLLSFTAVPLAGFLLYLLAGRGWKAFSQERKLAASALGERFIVAARQQILSLDEIAQRLKEGKPRSYDPNLLHLVAHNSVSGLSAFNQLEILQDAVEFYPCLLDDLRRATHHIHLQYYIWTNDDFTQEVRDVLIERARVGVKVRALYDASSRSSLGKEYIRSLQEAGVEILPYLAYNNLRTLHLANYRCHRKITVIDGKIGYLGGMNLDKEQMPGELWERWRDTQLRIEGGGARPLQVAFLTAWYNTTGEQLAEQPGYLPRLADEERNFLPVQITMSGPDAQWAGIRQLYFYMIVSARRHVYIQSPFFIPDETISEALKTAALSGVDVRIICTPRGATYQIPYRAANTYFAEMAEAGVRIFLYNKGYYHAKTVSVDSAICTIGSCNMDIRSYSVNYELNAVIYDEATTRQLENDFLTDLAECTEFDLAAYRERSVASRFVDSLYRLTSPLL